MKLPEGTAFSMEQELIHNGHRPKPWFVLCLSEGEKEISTAVWAHPFLLRLRLHLGLKRLVKSHRKAKKFLKNHGLA